MYRKKWPFFTLFLWWSEILMIWLVVLTCTFLISDNFDRVFSSGFFQCANPGCVVQKSGLTFCNTSTPVLNDNRKTDAIRKNLANFPFNYFPAFQRKNGWTRSQISICVKLTKISVSISIIEIYFKLHLAENEKNKTISWNLTSSSLKPNKKRAPGIEVIGNQMNNYPRNTLGDGLIWHFLHRMYLFTEPGVLCNFWSWFWFFFSWRKIVLHDFKVTSTKKKIHS